MEHLIPTDSATAADWLQRRLRHLYESGDADAQQFRYGLVAFDLITILFVVATSFLPRYRDRVAGCHLRPDHPRRFQRRLFISRQRLRDLMHPLTWADAAAIVSFLAPLIGEPAGFLRILRIRMLRSYHLLARLRADIPYFREHEEVTAVRASTGRNSPRAPATSAHHRRSSALHARHDRRP
jgi:voltage-gated potassium channel